MLTFWKQHRIILLSCVTPWNIQGKLSTVCFYLWLCVAHHGYRCVIWGVATVGYVIKRLAQRRDKMAANSAKQSETWRHHTAQIWAIFYMIFEILLRDLVVRNATRAPVFRQKSQPCTRSNLSLMNHNRESTDWVWTEQKRHLPTPFSGLCCCWWAAGHFSRVWNTGWPCLYALDIYIGFFPPKTLLKGANFAEWLEYFSFPEYVLVKALM